MNPLTMQEAEEMGVPVCFSGEYAFHERNGTLPPYSGPVYRDHNREDVDHYDDPEPAPPQPCQGPPPAFADLGMPPAWHPHDVWCWDLHARTADDICPPPF